MSESQVFSGSVYICMYVCMRVSMYVSFLVCLAWFLRQNFSVYP